jgi:hypothetical protein
VHSDARRDTGGPTRPAYIHPGFLRELGGCPPPGGEQGSGPEPGMCGANGAPGPANRHRDIAGSSPPTTTLIGSAPRFNEAPA